MPDWHRRTVGSAHRDGGVGLTHRGEDAVRVQQTRVLVSVRIRPVGESGEALEVGECGQLGCHLLDEIGVDGRRIVDARELGEPLWQSVRGLHAGEVVDQVLRIGTVAIPVQGEEVDSES